MIKKVVIVLIIVIIIPILMFFVLLGPTSKNKDAIKFEVVSGDTYSGIGNKLKEQGLIKSSLVYKIYIRFQNPKNLEACTYSLNKNMGTVNIVKELQKKCTESSDAVTVTIPEGKHIEQVAEIMSSVTNNTKENLLKVWNNEEFIDKLINEYEFITDEVKNKKIRYPLEGYLFPSTYELLNKDVTPEYIAYRMLEQTKRIYDTYKSDIVKSGYTFHEILTMASIVEYEAILDEERPIIAGIFYNRLNIDMKFQSCATLGYAIKEWKLKYTTADTRVDHPYNTYFYAGFPPGPGNMPGEKSIIAAIKPAKTDYLFFLANVCDPNNKKSEFSKTNAEHERKAEILKQC